MPSIQTILAPQGAEYQAVCRGLRGLTQIPLVRAIPVGPAAVSRYLTRLQAAESLEQTAILVMGLCGSLTAAQTVGDRVLYQDCCWHGTGEDTAPSSLLCDRALTDSLSHQLGITVPQVRAVTRDRLVVSAADKQQLAQQVGAAVVDMEGYAVLQTLGPAGVSIAMLRVVSDDSQHDLPDLSAAIGPEGNLKPLPLAWGMVRQPIAATRLIRGSLRGLKILEQTTAELFGGNRATAIT